jgi:hypothetical protein
MTAIGEPDRADIVQDGEDIRALLATRHGRQRRRAGFSRDDIQREYAMLTDMIESYVRREAAQRTTADVDDAIATLRRLLDRGCSLSIAAYDAA